MVADDLYTGLICRRNRVEVLVICMINAIKFIAVHTRARMKRSLADAFQQEQDGDVSLDSDIWDVIRSYWALLKLVSRWGIIKSALNETRDTVFCSEDELALRRADKQLGWTDSCYVAGIESFVWYGQYIAVVCCRNILSGIGDGRVVAYARLNIYLSWVTENAQYDRFLNDHLLSGENQGVW